MFAILLAIGISYTLHAKDVFQPPKAQAQQKWSESAPRRESLEFQTMEGTTLRGWLYRTEKHDAPYVVFFYGTNEDLSHEANRLAWLSDTMHVNAICFDYPGYGFSSGLINIKTIEFDALQEFDYVKRQFLSNTGIPVFSYGWSIGTGIAIHVAKERQVSGLILQAPPASSKEMLQWSSKHDVPWYGRGFIKMKADPAVTQVYEGATKIRKVNSPLLVIHGQLDDVVPIEQGREVFAASPAIQKQFVEVPAAHHNDLRFTKPPASDVMEHFIHSISENRTN